MKKERTSLEIKSKNVGLAAPKSCASAAIMCIAMLGLSEDYASAYAMHIENAKRLGLIPNDLRAIRYTLETDHGFVMQSTRLEGGVADEVALNIFNKLSADDLVIMQISDYEYRAGGSMAALKPDGCSYKVVYPWEGYDLFLTTVCDTYG